jgi:mannobiose 2-epimerase
VPLLALALLFNVVMATARDLSEHARAWKTQLQEKVLPYWHDTAQDKEHGGYLLADDLKGRGSAREKQLVTQSRMIWGFSHAHRKGFGGGGRDYLQAARQGYHFLIDHFLDRAHGGYFWKTDLAGRPMNERKIIYGEAFVIYGLVEYHRASREPEALQQAMDLYHVLQQRAHDRKRGGWIEHFQRDWTPILKPEPGAEVEVAGLKSANAHLHLMEALAELYDVTRDKAVKESLEESLRLNTRYFYPKLAGQSCFHRQRDWQPVADPQSAGLSYGHNVEFAWLMIRAQRVLGRRPAWTHFYAHLDHALKFGYDHERGGLYNRGVDDQPATQTDKVWWVQSEMLAALTDALEHRPNAAYRKALDQLLHFLDAHQIDPADGIWLDTVTAEGKPKATGKAHNWKANYHDVRALVKFIEVFERGR